MSNDALWVSDAMLDSLSMQLRDAEARRAEAERAHQVSWLAVAKFFLLLFSQCQQLIFTFQSIWKKYLPLHY